ncbi:hypothetical protein BU24DRAFT_429188 [Aaosphaeria arxii CBS 175.79]|uniref:Uncharacterized protein n=1 Tax=Aaosphaeria arxii CBS 175.79 TaxID=1450172 RepID=A0A6A5X6R8_9PLEO|nr:uncharacterized protein BU24DRAFT_429188 [Aaosphaeria arxii CBS 175.79]KAF2008591.1 hypothetical protein BU24DRAFT_429188 [Aaosphaeria arxii CBS 175.79]
MTNNDEPVRQQASQRALLPNCHPTPARLLLNPVAVSVQPHESVHLVTRRPLPPCTLQPE